MTTDAAANGRAANGRAAKTNRLTALVSGSTVLAPNLTGPEKAGSRAALARLFGVLPMSQPLISVIIPTCDRPDALARCLKHLAPDAQTLDAERYEVIVSDDGRASARAMMEAQFPWARWVAGPRRGPAANRNCGARAARGAWLAFTDDDCLPDPRWLQSYAAALNENFEIYEGVTRANGPLRAPLLVAPVNVEGGLLWSCNVLVGRELFARMGGFDEGFPHAADEDTDFRERAHKRGEAFRFVSDALILHPPVRRPWGRRSARLWEAKVRLAHKADPLRAPVGRREMVWSALNTRGRQLLRSPLHLDWLLALWGMAIELIWIARHTPRWDRKHRASLRARLAGEPGARDTDGTL